MDTSESHSFDAAAHPLDDSLRRMEERELIRVLTCGNVDDGKSTLIGRLFHDADQIAADKLIALARDSKRYGTTGSELDPALLADGLKAEREQGITIDVSHLYFSLPERAVTLVDAPGHEQFTRNMVTGASNADLAIILLDVKEGVRLQTKRHAFLCSLLGIKHVIVAVNKMDTVAYERAAFERVRNEVSAFATRLDMRDLHFIPVSALYGDNVVEPSSKMPWFRGGTLRHLLRTVHIASDRNLIDFRFPVQYVLRAENGARCYAGTIASGVVRPGDEVLVLPSETRTKVSAVRTFDGELDSAFAPQSVSLQLEDRMDVTRGDMIVRPNNRPRMVTSCDAMLVWFDEEKLVLGKDYLLMHTTHAIHGSIQKLRYRLNVESLKQEPADTLAMNQIGRCLLSFSRPLALDAYRRNRTTGSIVLVDRMTSATVGAAVVVERRAVSESGRSLEPKSDTLRFEKSTVDEAERRKRLRQRPATLLLTGLTGSGKSTLAAALEKALFERAYTAVVLDAENLRLGLTRDLGFTAADRHENVRRAMEVARLLNHAGQIAICAMIAPARAMRERARELIGEDRFLLVHLDVPVEICRDRHDKGLYEAVKRGHYRDVPGHTSIYEPPEAPDLLLGTEDTIEACVAKVLALLENRGFLLSEERLP